MVERRVLLWAISIAIIGSIICLEYLWRPSGAIGGRFSCEGCNLVLISIDTLRADHLGAYGYGRDTSPFIDELAGKSIMFTNAFATSAQTAPSHMSIFTSVFPRVHQVSNANAMSMEGPEFMCLGSGLVTFPEILDDAGYTNMGFTQGGAVEGEIGFARGFAFYGNNASIDDAIRWVRQDADGKFFLFFHTYKTHAPYFPKHEFDVFSDRSYDGPILASEEELLRIKDGRKMRKSEKYFSMVDPSDPDDVRHLKDLYDGEILEVDSWMKHLVTTIRQEHPDTIIIFTSDHGEEFYEHGNYGHQHVYNEVARVPLLIWHPRVDEPIQVSERVSQIDLAPTILDFLGIGVASQFEGESLASVIEGGRKPDGLFIDFFGRRALIRGDYKLVADEKGSGLYDIGSDPSEVGKISDEPLKKLEMQARLLLREVGYFFGRKLIAYDDCRTMQANPERLEWLRYLGYVD
ncbi:sulfatase [Candidatus Altiarchaeota archaeon]